VLASVSCCHRSFNRTGLRHEAGCAGRRRSQSAHSGCHPTFVPPSEITPAIRNSLRQQLGAEREWVRMIVDEIRGSAVVLTPWAEHDAQWYVDSRDDMVFEFTTESRDLTVSQTSDAIRRVAASEAEVAFAIWTAQGELVGNVALLVADRVAEISYFWRRPAEGGATHQRPYGSRQSGAFRNLDIDHVVALVVPANNASANVVERAGFAPVGRRHHNVSAR